MSLEHLALTVLLAALILAGVVITVTTLARVLLTAWRQR